MLSEQDTDRLRELARVATPGPWVVGKGSGADEMQRVTVDAPNGDPTLGHGRWDAFIYCWGCDDQREEGLEVATANADFIAAARTAVPVLLADLDAAANAIHDLQQESGAYDAGMQVERQRWRDMVARHIDWWQNKTTSARLAAGPVRALTDLLGDLPGPGRELPPDQLRAENERLRRALQRVLELHARPYSSWAKTSDAMRDEALEALGEADRS